MQCRKCFHGISWPTSHSYNLHCSSNTNNQGQTWLSPWSGRTKNYWNTSWKTSRGCFCFILLVNLNQFHVWNVQISVKPVGRYTSLLIAIMDGHIIDVKLLQSSAVIMRSNIVRYYMNNYRNWDRISTRCGFHIRHPISRANGRAMGCLLWIFVRKLTAL